MLPNKAELTNSYQGCVPFVSLLVAILFVDASGWSVLWHWNVSESQPVVGLTDSNWTKSVSDNDLSYTETTLFSQDVS